MRGLLKKQWLVSGWMLIAVCCGWLPVERPTSSEPDQFFANAKRREASNAEGKLVLRVPGCTAFFIENTKNLAIVASARHCYEFSATTFCETGGGFQTNDGEVGRCLNVLAGDAEHDLVMFRAEFPFVPGPEHTLRASSFRPEVGTRLKMIGYPGDPERRGRLTVTDQCWILQRDAMSPYSTERILDGSARHNCSTYGGNSGGPMILEGSRIVLGLPFTYIPNDFTQNPPDRVESAAFMARMADFIERHRGVLLDAGVVLAQAEDTAAGAYADPTKDKRLFVALSANTDTPEAMISTSNDITDVTVCEGKVEASTCASAATNARQGRLNRPLDNGRLLFVTGSLPLPPVESLIFTVVARNADGVVMGQRTFAIEPN